VELSTLHIAQIESLVVDSVLLRLSLLGREATAQALGPLSLLE